MIFIIISMWWRNNVGVFILSHILYSYSMSTCWLMSCFKWYRHNNFLFLFWEKIILLHITISSCNSSDCQNIIFYFKIYKLKLKRNSMQILDLSNILIFLEFGSLDLIEILWCTRKNQKNLCAKFQLSSWSKSAWKVCCGGGGGWEHVGTMSNPTKLLLSCFELSWVELSYVGFWQF